MIYLLIYDLHTSSKENTLHYINVRAKTVEWSAGTISFDFISKMKLFFIKSLVFFGVTYLSHNIAELNDQSCHAVIR